VAKDRARPFSRKHRKYWIPVTGGMIVIGAINVGLGYCTYSPTPEPPQRILIPDTPDPAAEMAKAAAKRAFEKKAAAEKAASSPRVPPASEVSPRPASEASTWVPPASGGSPRDPAPLPTPAPK
jgi:hypothetical protein